MGLTRLPATLAAVAASILLAAGCGSDEGDVTTLDRGELPPPSQSAHIAVGAPLEHLDPLYTETRAERMLSRQIYDPVVARIDPPLGMTGTRRGPTRPIEETAHGDWIFQIRPYARFQDGADLDADAVVANSRRWFASGLAARLLPELDAVDQPFPDKVRFQLSTPVSNFPARLADPRLGLVSPAALPTSPFAEVEGGLGGSGAYRPTLVSGDRVVLGASDAWWGKGAGLGPGIESIEFQPVPSPLDRLALLSDGAVEIADDLGPGAARVIAGQPLLIAAEQGDRLVGASAAVRGLRSGAIAQPLSEVWLTTLR